ncbi:MAG TPA: hypothetical protein VH682_22130 [Gemmataceae bacterium]|jgi:hypothetical protein
MDIIRGRSWLSLVFTTCFVLAACLSTYLLGTFLAERFVRSESGLVASPVSSVPGLSIEPVELNLGEVWEDPDFTALVQLRNTSDHDIAVSKFSTSCTCSGIEPPSPVVPAKGSVPLKVKMDLTHSLPHAWGVERRPFSLAIHPIVTGGEAPNGWEITGIVRSRVSLSDLRLEFADQCTHAGPAVRRKVRATAYLPLAALEATPQPHVASVHIEPLRESPGEYEIVIAPDPNLPVGAFQFKVPVTAVAPEDVRYRCATIQVCGEMQPSTRIVPGVVLLGEHSLGGEAAAEVSVRFPDRSGWAVDRVVVESPHLKLTPNGSFADGAPCYRVTQKIVECGDRESKATFVVAKGGGEWETVELKIRYHGVALKGDEAR